MLKIVSDFNELSIPCDLVSDMNEGIKIAEVLFKVLEHNDGGIGLAANQVGLNKAVCVVNVKKPLYLINPQIVGVAGEVVLEEGCLSFANRVIKTKRHQNILVRADNLEEDTIYGDDSDMGSIIESVCIQHEIDHINGITFWDRENK
tara:strand:- start:11273 stop:11713 length:441 start_codon:yes stop_codon:yes gene_type:complete